MVAWGNVSASDSGFCVIFTLDDKASSAKLVFVRAVTYSYRCALDNGLRNACTVHWAMKRVNGPIVVAVNHIVDGGDDGRFVCGG